MVGQDPSLRALIFAEMEARCDHMRNDAERALFLKELMIVATTGLEIYADPQTTLGVLAGLTSYTMNSPALAGPRALAERKATGATVQ